MKFKVGDKVRLNEAGARFAVDDFYDDGRLVVGSEGVVTDTDTVGLPYEVDWGYGHGTWWVREEAIELVSAMAPTPPLTFSKTTILSFPGFVFTLDSEGNVSLRDTDYAEDAISLPFATLVAAVDELRKEATPNA